MVGNRRGEAARALLLDAGRAAFSQQRYEEVSIVDLAKSLNVAAGSISYHFGGKRGFYLAVLEDAANTFWGGLLSMRGPATERLERGIDAFLDLAEQHPGSFEALIADVSDTEVRQIHDAHRQRIADALATELTGTDPSPVLRAAISGCLSFVEGVILHWIHSTDLTRHQVRELILMNFYNTILTTAHVDPSIQFKQRITDAVDMTADSLADAQAPAAP